MGSGLALDSAEIFFTLRSGKGETHSAVNVKSEDLEIGSEKIELARSILQVLMNLQW